MTVSTCTPTHPPTDVLDVINNENLPHPCTSCKCTFNNLIDNNNTYHSFQSNTTNCYPPTLWTVDCAGMIVAAVLKTAGFGHHGNLALVVVTVYNIVVV